MPTASKLPSKVPSASELVDLFTKIYDSVELIIHRFKNHSTPLHDNPPFLCKAERFALSCGILRLVQTGLLLERDLATGLSEDDYPTTPGHVDEVCALVEYINANREQVITDKLARLTDRSGWDRLVEGELIEDTMALL